MSAVNLKLAEEQPQPAQLTQIGAEYRKSGTTTLSSPQSVAKRYDEATVQRVLALAMEIQTDHRSTLTAEQIVAIGEEASIEPEFVRRALAVIDRETTGVPRSRIVSMYPANDTVARTYSLRFRPLPRIAKRAAATIPSVYTLLTLLQFDNPTIGVESRRPEFILGNVFVLAPLLALSSGMFLRSKRLGFASGFFIGAGVLASFLITSGPINLEGMDSGLFVWQALAFSCAGGALGVTGAVLRNDGPRIWRRILAGVNRMFPDPSDAT